MSDVVPFKNYAIPSTDPVPEIVGILRNALRDAEEGKLEGVALATVRRAPTETAYAMYGEHNLHLIAATAILYDKVVENGR